MGYVFYRHREKSLDHFCLLCSGKGRTGDKWALYSHQIACVDPVWHSRSKGERCPNVKGTGGGSSKGLILLSILVCEWTYTRCVRETDRKILSEPHSENREQLPLEDVAALGSQCLWEAGLTIHLSKQIQHRDIIYLLAVTCECLWCPQIRNSSHYRLL